ncbi:8860_t:CDS:1, partial [Ambispora gerdemannii]
MSKVYQKIDINSLDFERSYTLKEFELINKQLKTHSLEIDGKSVDLFELDANGKLLPMPQATI